MSEPVTVAPLVAVGEDSGRGPDRLAIAIILALIVAFLGQVARFPFVSDDHLTILNNPVVGEWRNLLRLFSSQFAREGVPDAARPVMLASVMLDVSLWGRWPTGFHLQNLVLHGLAASLLLLAARHVTQSLPMALFTAALFAVHPVVVEPVAVVNYREDLLAACFVLLGLFAVAAGRRAPSRGASMAWKGGAFVSFILAAGAQESAYVAPFLILLADLFLPREGSDDTTVRGLPPGRGGRERWLDAGLAAAAVVLVATWRMWVMGQVIVVPVRDQATDWHPFYRLIEIAYGFVAGAIHVVYPFGLAPEYNPVVRDGLGLMLGLLALLLMLSSVAAALIFRRRAPLASLAYAWAVVTFLPTFALAPAANERADRYLYLPMMGLALLLVEGVTRATIWLAAKVRRHRVPLTVLGMPLAWLLAALSVTGYGFAARTRSLVWASEAQLWFTAVTQAPYNPRPWVGWISHLIQQGETHEAHMAATKAAGRFGGDPRLRELLGLTYLRRGSVETACDVLQQLGDEGTPYDRAQRASNLGYCLMRLHQYEDALPHLEKARRLAPWYARGWAVGIETLRRMGRPQEEEALRKEYDARQR